MGALADTEAFVAMQMSAPHVRCDQLRYLTIRAGFQEVDVCDFEFEPADLIAAYYTIQFIRPDRRQKLFDRVYQSLKWGGAFIMFEKVRAPDARFQDMMSTLYAEYKLENGFSEVEIVQKARSLKGVLEPFSSGANQEFLKRAGFVDYMTIWKNICFEGILAIK
jgi:tRNA (cmo5U34)-methyltransferase